MVLSYAIDEDAGLPIHLAATYFNVTPATVKGWVTRGWADRRGRRHTVRVVGTDWRYGRLYRFGDLVEAERAAREHPNSSRSEVRRKPAVAA